MTTKAQATKEKTDKLDFIKVKDFWTLEDIINRVKRQSTYFRENIKEKAVGKRMVIL